MGKSVSISITQTHEEKDLSGPAGTVWAGYLPCRPAPAACVAHWPAEPFSGHGVVICAPLGGPDLFTHRIRRHWAEALADAGHCALRVDLPGTGDSVGEPLSLPCVTAWTEALGVAARWLADEAGCTRVTVLGIASAALLGWLAAATDGGVHDLILWGMPLNGRQLLRELRAAAQLSIDPELPPELRDAYGPVPTIDEAGQPMSADTIEQLSAIEPTQLPLSDGRVLLLDRPHSRTDQAVRALLESAPGRGVQLTVSDGSEFEDIMRYVQVSITPRAAIAASLRWLENAPRGNPASISPRPTLNESVEFDVDGVTVRERAAGLSLSTGRARAIVTEPVAAPGADVTTLFINPAADRRTGPNRLHVTTARRWATRGVTSIRIDSPGIGDAPGDEQSWTGVWAVLSPRKTAECREVIEAARAAGLPRRLILVGFCSGGFRALRLAPADPEVVGLVAIGPRNFRRSWWRLWIIDHWLSGWKPEPRHGRTKLALVRALRRGARLARFAQKLQLQVGQIAPNRAERLLTRLTAQGTEVALILRPEEAAFEQLTPDRRQARLRRESRLAMHLLPSPDARFRPLQAQAWVQERLDGTLDRVLATATDTDTDTDTAEEEKPSGGLAGVRSAARGR